MNANVFRGGLLWAAYMIAPTSDDEVELRAWRNWQDLNAKDHDDAKLFGYRLFYIHKELP